MITIIEYRSKNLEKINISHESFEIMTQRVFNSFNTEEKRNL